MSNQKQSPFFQLPAEIREIIYKEAVQRDTELSVIMRRDVTQQLMFDRGDFDNCPEGNDMRSEAWEAWRMIHYQDDPVSVPFLNGLSQTCKQAYSESCHLFFKLHSFRICDTWFLNRFVEAIPPAHLQQIRELTVPYFWCRNTQMSFSPKRRGRIDARNLKLLTNFDNLQVLHLEEYRFGNERPVRRNRERLMRQLVLASQKIKSLQVIIVKSPGEMEDLEAWQSVAPDPESIPGWMYSCRLKAVPDEPWTIHVTETLQRVQGPLWPTKMKCSGAAGDSIEYVKEAMDLFTADN